MGVCLSTVAEVVAEDNAHQQTSHAEALAHEQSKPGFRLSTVDPGTIPAIPYKDQVIRVKIYDVHDGDTIHVILAFGDFPVKMALRILGVDAPETRASKDRLPQEKVAGLKARDHVREVLGEYTKIKLIDWDKYGGRMLAEVYLPNGQSLTDHLINGGYAKPYRGEKKSAWTLDELTSGPYAGISRDLPPDLE